MNKTLNLSTSYMSSESDDVSMLSSLSSLSSLEPLEEPVPAQAQPQPKEPSKRRRLQESDIESFFTFLDELVDELRAEGKGASKLPELRRPSSMNRGDDIQTYRFGDAANTIRTQLPITFAVITAIAGVGEEQSAVTVDQSPSAVASVVSTLPLTSRLDRSEPGSRLPSPAPEARQSGSTGQHRTDEERDLEEHELDDIWQDIDEIGHQQPSAEDEEGEPSSKQAPVSKRGKRSPMVIAMAATMMLLLARNVTISRFQSGNARSSVRSRYIRAIKGRSTAPTCDPKVFTDALGANMPKPTTAVTSMIEELVASSPTRNPWPELRRQRDELRQKPLPKDLHPAD
ncbi:unnamed protein product [Tilletia caries]|nr:unnamed protein product [Tilletia caries]